MAALLKKRAVAEYTQVIQEEPSTSSAADVAQPPLKKLRLRKKTSSSLPTGLDLQSVVNSQQAMEQLLRFRRSVTFSEINDPETLLRQLLDHFYKERESHVRVQVVTLIGALIHAPNFDSNWIVDDLISCLKQEDSEKVLAQIVQTLLLIGNQSPNDAKLHKSLIEVAKQYLAVNDHVVRMRCIELIAHLVSAHSSQEQFSTVHKLLGELTEDQDPRVRSTAFQALLSLHDRGIELHMNAYEQAGRSLSDSYEGVRLAAMKLFWKMTQTYPERMVEAPDKESIRLVDDGFAKICFMLNDTSMKVRAEAARLLGSMHQVSSKFLEQTLDKKLMSNMRRKAGAHERQKKHFEKGEWATGNKWASDAPMELLNAESVTVINTGACGAFVHGLEDEFLEARSAAVMSMCELAHVHADFAVKSLDFLVDMFNDEIESVRLLAINCLLKLVAHIVLREDQLETVLAVLQDSSYEIREGIHELLGASTLSTTECVRMCIHKLLANLTRYPQDRTSIWKCLKNIGKAHASLTLPLIPELLASHPYFDSTEPDMDDPAYISTLVLVFNAAQHCTTMIPLFHDFTISHYSYLRDSFPELIPEIRQLTQHSTLKVNAAERKTADAFAFFSDVEKRLADIDNMDQKTRLSLLRLSLRDLQCISKVEPELSARAQCLSFYIQCLLYLHKALLGANGVLRTEFGLQENSVATFLAEKILDLTCQLEHIFLNLTNAEVTVVKCMWGWSLSVQLLVGLQTTQRHINKVMMCQNYLDKMKRLQRALFDLDVKPDSFIQSVFDEFPKLDADDTSSVKAMLQCAMGEHLPSMLTVSGNVKQSSAQIVHPSSESDNPLKFTAGLTLPVHMDIMLDNIVDVRCVRIKVVYPDQRVDLLIPKRSDFKKRRDGQYRLVTCICLSHGVWTEACHVELCVAYLPLETDSTKQSENLLDGIELSNTVKVYVSPVSVRKCSVT